MAVGKVIQNVSCLLPTGRHHAENAFDEAAARLAVGAAAALSPEDRVASGALGCVVRRLDPFTAHKSPQPRLVRQQVAARSGRLRAAANGAALKVLAERRSQPANVGLERPAAQRSIANLMPPVKQNVRMREQRLADWLARSVAIDHRLEVAPQMSPAPLQPFQAPVCLPAVARGDEPKLAQQLFDNVFATRAGHAEDRRHRGDDQPQPSLVRVLFPTGLVDVDVLRLDVLAKIVIDRLQQSGGLLLEFADHSSGDGQATQVQKQLPNRSLAQPVGSREQANRRRQAWAEASAGSSRGHRAGRLAAAPRAGERVDDVLGDVRPNRWNLGDLMPIGLRVVSNQNNTAAGAVRGPARDDFIDLLGRDQRALMPWVAEACACGPADRTTAAWRNWKSSASAGP